MPSTKIAELVTFGGVDSRSNPLSMPPGKCLRVQNWCPQPGGYLKQRYGFSTASYFATLTPAYQSNSAYYFEVDEEATGSTPTVQGVIIGYQPGTGAVGDSGSVSQIMLGATPTVSLITSHSDGLPFAIYQQDNKIYIPCGDVEPGFTDDQSGAPTSAADGGGLNTWANPLDVASTGSYATVPITFTIGPPFPTNTLNAWSFSLVIPAKATIVGIQVDLYADYSATGASGPASLGCSLKTGPFVITGSGGGPFTLTTSLTHLTFGGPTNLWSITPGFINPAMFNSMLFGVQLIATSLGYVGDTVTVSANSLTMTVYFSQQGSSDTWFTDGITPRRSGIRAPYNLEASSVTASPSTATPGDWAPTIFQGYQLYMAYYNPNTGHVGNRIQIASPLIIPAVGLALTSAGPSYAGVTVYNGTITGGASNALVGLQFTVQGFTNPGNNGGPFVCVGSSTITISLQNPGGVMETATASATNNSNSGDSVVVTGLPDLSSVNTEWVKLIGRTSDGGEIPYALIDTGTGDWVTVPNAATSATLTVGDVDFTSELPYANGLPPLMHKTAVALGRVYAIDDTNPTLIDYSESAADIYGSENFVGIPTQSWNPLNQIPNPTGEANKCIQSIDNEIWAFSRNFLSIITELGLYSPDGNPSPYVRKTVPGGCPGQRAFCQRRNSPYWLNSYKQLMTRGEDVPVSVSQEYEAGLLAKLIDSYMDSVELIYHCDPLRFIDRIYICGVAYDPSRTLPQSPYYVGVFVHDFAMGGIGYEYDYWALYPVLFVRDATSSYSFRDINQKIHLLFLDNDSSDAPIYQMEEGDLTDGGGTITSDMISIVNLGAQEPKLAGIDISGDNNLVVTHTKNLLLDLPGLNSLTPANSTPLDNGDSQCGRFRIDIDDGAEYITLRLQLVSHPADAPANGLDMNFPPHIPLELYGRVYILRNEIGATRPVGGLAP